MPSTVTRHLKTHMAQQFLESVTEGPSSSNNSLVDTYYVAVGRQNSYNSQDGGSDAAPPSPDTSDLILDTLWFKNLISGKKIGSGDVSLGVKRIDWVSGTQYAQYDSLNANNFIEASANNVNNFYVLTDDDNVYKVISNNKSANSIIKPTSTATTGTFSTSDGYRWKYLFTLSATQKSKFLSSTVMPVADSTGAGTQRTIENNAVDGTIDHIQVTNVGTGYDGHANCTVSSYNTTTKAVVLTGSEVNNSINDLYKDASLYVSAGTGAGQIEKIISYNASTKTATLRNAFSTALDTTSTVVISPSVRITSLDNPSIVAKAFSSVSGTGNTISDITMVNVGKGYNRAEVNIFGKLNANNVSIIGENATGRALVSNKGGHGHSVVRELGADKVIINAQLTGTQTGQIPVGTQFRNVLLLKNPVFANTRLSVEGNVEGNSQIKTQNAASVALPNTFIQFTTRLAITTSDPSNRTFPINDIIRGQSTNATGRVVSANTTRVVVNYVEGAGDNKATTVTLGSHSFITSRFAAGETVESNTISGLSATVNDVTHPDVINRLGEVLYVQTIKPITRLPDQTEDFKIVLDF